MSNDFQLRFLIAPEFKQKHERALTLYLQDDRKLSTDQWRLLYEGINHLDQSEVEISGERFTFRQLYNRHIDQAFADEYLEQLIGLIELDAHGPTLTAHMLEKLRRHWNSNNCCCSVTIHRAICSLLIVFIGGKVSRVAMPLK